jgi:2-polyprenyl-3-methyl-5-hydroxy-6-metoxy-1,4-benzoquinol methylase
MKIKDHLVTQETFDVNYHKELDCLKTNVETVQSFDKYYTYETYQSHNQNEKGLFNKLYKLAQKYNLNYKFKLINQLQVEEKKILDYGCGVGDFILKMTSEKWQAQGYEPNEEAKKILANKNIVTVNSIEEIANESLGIITLWHVLEHVANPADVLQTLKRKLKTNGCLVIALPNYKSFDAKYYGNHWAAYDVPRHIYHFQRQSIRLLSKKINMQQIQERPLWLDAIYISLLSEKYKKPGNAALGIIIGFISNFLSIFTHEQSSIVYILRKT